MNQRCILFTSFQDLRSTHQRSTFIGVPPWSLSKSFCAFDKGSVDKPWLEQITRRRIKLVSRSICFATNAAAASAAGITVDVSLTCPFPFLFILYAEGGPSKFSFFLFFQSVVRQRYLGWNLYLQDLTLVASVSKCRDERSNQFLCFSRFRCCLLLHPGSRICGRCSKESTKLENKEVTMGRLRVSDGYASR